MLEVESLDVRYGRTHAVKAVSLSVGAGELVTVLGANGAGKSSLLKAILGSVKPAAGAIRFDGADVTSAPIAQRMREGLVLVPEGRRILVSLTVHENLLIGAYTRSSKRTIAAETDAVYDRFPNLGARRNVAAAVLSGGEQQMLAIGRALMTNPSVLILDEPLEGLAPVIIAEVSNCLRRLVAEEGTTLILVEQRAAFALEMTSQAIVLERGRIVHASSSKSLAGDEELLDRVIGMRKLHESAKELAQDEASA
jgi:branched-chain amino acid transport system ATP-binding protein